MKLVQKEKFLLMKYLLQGSTIKTCIWTSIKNVNLVDDGSKTIIIWYWMSKRYQWVINSVT